MFLFYLLGHFNVTFSLNFTFHNSRISLQPIPMYQPLDMIPVKGLVCLLYLTKCSLPWFSRENTLRWRICTWRKSIKEFFNGSSRCQNAATLVFNQPPLFCAVMKTDIQRLDMKNYYFTEPVDQRNTLGKSYLSLKFWAVSCFLAPKIKYFMFTILFLRYVGITILSNLTLMLIGHNFRKYN